MTSVASSGASPHSPYDLPGDGDADEEIWAFLPAQGSSSASSVGFLPSPSTGSLRSWVQIGHAGQLEHTEGIMAPSPPAPSPLYLDSLQGQASFPASTFGEQMLPLSVTSAPLAFGTTFVPTQVDETAGFVMPENFLFPENLDDLLSLDTFNANVPLTGLESLPAVSQQPQELHIPQSMQGDGSASPWNPANPKSELVFLSEEFVSPSPSARNSSPSATSSSQQGASPVSPIIKQEGRSPAQSAPIAIRRVRGAGARVEKKKALSSSSSVAGSGSSGKGQFVIVTPDDVQGRSGKGNQWECFEAMRPSQRGRKGPLANETKENALQVRRLGACFCCHARKVKCDKERPCKNCKKLCMQVPQVVCWQFQDFMTVLFPDLIREHLRKEEVAKFIAANVEGFYVNGKELPCEVTLFSGSRFTATLILQAKFFTAKTTDILEHWHLTTGAQGGDELRPERAVPIGLEVEGSAQRDELRRKAREYVQHIVAEPSYPEQLTDSTRHTDVPRQVLRIVYEYSQQTESPLVKKALNVCAMHYIMTRHLCLTRQSIINLSGTQLVPQNLPWVTPRMLNRQIKAVVDELLQREVQTLFDTFSKSLKPKSRREWAPSLAAFLVLCLVMESVEAANDSFVTLQNEVDLRAHRPLSYRRGHALKLNREIENMPFAQFAFQFHHVYQTHSRDAASKGFNPLVDDAPIEQGDLEPAAIAMVLKLRSLLEQPNWGELDYLTMDPILPNVEEHPYPRELNTSYIGRLVARFLLSFTDEKYIFGLL